MRTSLFDPFTEIDLPLPDRRDGKVRVSWSVGGRRRLIVTTDRLSAFDRVLAGVPYKGQVLNQFSLDEFDSHLRIATTSGKWGGSAALHNAVSVFKQEGASLKQTGRVDPTHRM